MQLALSMQLKKIDVPGTWNSFADRERSRRRESRPHHRLLGSKGLGAHIRLRAPILIVAVRAHTLGSHHQTTLPGGQSGVGGVRFLSSSVA